MKKECIAKYVTCSNSNSSVAMDLNITGVDNQLYYDVIVALNVCFFIFLSLLPLLLCVLILLALVLAKTINIKIRVILVNIFAVEIVHWISYGIFSLGWIVRLNNNEIVSCKISYTARAYFTQLFITVPGIATPIVAIAILKPVRDAIKTMLKNMFCKKDNRIHPTVDSNTIELTSTT